MCERQGGDQIASNKSSNSAQNSGGRTDAKLVQFSERAIASWHSSFVSLTIPQLRKWEICEQIQIYSLNSRRWMLLLFFGIFSRFTKWNRSAKNQIRKSKKKTQKLFLVPLVEHRVEICMRIRAMYVNVFKVPERCFEIEASWALRPAAAAQTREKQQLFIRIFNFI